MRARVKLFFDGGCRPGPDGMETAVVVNGRPYLTRGLGPGSSMDAEWLALIHAAQIAIALELTQPVLLGDALAVIGQATGTVRCPAAYTCHLEALRLLGTLPRIRYVKRTQNLAGIALARLHPR